MHQHDALLKRGMQDRLVFPDLDLDTDRLEANDMLVSHDFLTHVRPIRKWDRTSAGEECPRFALGPSSPVDYPNTAQSSAGAGRFF